MPAVFQFLGPIDHYIRADAGLSWSYLGTSVTSPNFESTEGLIPIMNDLGGRTFPMQYTMDRRQEMVTTTLNRFNWTTYNQLRQTRPVGGGSPATYSDETVDHGVPTIGFLDFQLLMVFTHGATFSSPATPQGRLYYSAIPRKFSENSVGTRTCDLSILFECNGKFDPTTRAFPVYTENPGQFGGFAPE